MCKKKENVIIFGAGLICDLIIEDILANYNLLCIIDNNPNKQGKTVHGIAIHGIEYLKTSSFDTIIIASSQPQAMAKELYKLGVEIHKMTLGANFALNKYYNKTPYPINFIMDKNFQISLKNSSNLDGLIIVDSFFDKLLMFHEHHISTLVGLCGDNNRLPTFFNLSSKFCDTNEGIFLDIGANIGTSSLEAISHNKVTKCIAFEPATDNFTILNTNITINNLQEKIQAYQFAVSNTKEITHLVLSETCSGDNSISSDSKTLSSSRTETVQSIIIDDFLKDNLNEIKFLWVDVQGYEYYVLSGCKELLKHGNVAVQIEYWPKALRRNSSIDELNNFLINNFDSYIDLNEYNADQLIIHDINNIVNLENKLIKQSPSAYTDIFLINKKVKNDNI